MPDTIERRWQQLVQHPQFGMEREDMAPSVRHLIVGKFLTLYRSSGNGIKIVRVIHGRRKMGRKLVEQGRN